ncbi:DNA-methyltransferase [Bacillus salipaludis]|uniref:Methyltransferase n=1 Tax=Bacillus salipaludis TaxID=2547811 RepID=A0ABW8RE59_9BACI
MNNEVIKDNRNNYFPDHFTEENVVTLFPGNCEDFLHSIENESIQLIITSPPYNVGKDYEKAMPFEEYINWQDNIIKLCIDKLKPEGSICWQVGNYVDKKNSNEIYPLDIYLYNSFKSRGMKLRNRIVWHFGHGLHAKNRFSGRYETILWFTKSDDYVFNLDSVRIPQKYPGKKAYKGDRAGEYSGNPLGKNPSDVWEIPNVKSQHVEKTEHPCQFPVALINRLVLALSNENDLVFDPFMGVGTTQVSSLLNNRRTAGCEIMPKYMEIAKSRIIETQNGTIKFREDKPVYSPPSGTSLTTNPFNKPE